MEQISFFESERQLTKLELKGKRLYRLAIMLLFLLLASNAAWYIKCVWR